MLTEGSLADGARTMAAKKEPKPAVDRVQMAARALLMMKSVGKRPRPKVPLTRLCYEKAAAAANAGATEVKKTTSPKEVGKATASASLNGENENTSMKPNATDRRIVNTRILDSLNKHPPPEAAAGVTYDWRHTYEERFRYVNIPPPRAALPPLPPLPTVEQIHKLYARRQVHFTSEVRRSMVPGHLALPGHPPPYSFHMGPPPSMPAPRPAPKRTIKRSENPRPRKKIAPSKDFNPDLVKRVKQLQARFELTQVDVMRASGISNTVLCDWSQGRYRGNVKRINDRLIKWLQRMSEFKSHADLPLFLRCPPHTRPKIDERLVKINLYVQLIGYRNNNGFYTVTLTWDLSEHRLSPNGFATALVRDLVSTAGLPFNSQNATRIADAIDAKLRQEMGRG